MSRNTRPKIQFMIPALPRTVQLNFEDGEVIKTHVLAWGATVNGVAYPITFSPYGFRTDASKEESWASCFLLPDGTVPCRYGTYPSFGAWLEQQKKVAK